MESAFDAMKPLCKCALRADETAGRCSKRAFVASHGSRTLRGRIGTFSLWKSAPR